MLDKNKAAAPPKPFLLGAANQEHISSLSVTTGRSKNIRWIHRARCVTEGILAHPVLGFVGDAQRVWLCLTSLCSGMPLLPYRDSLTEEFAQVTLRGLAAPGTHPALPFFFTGPWSCFPSLVPEGGLGRAVGHSCVSLQGSGAFAAALAAWR